MEFVGRNRELAIIDDHLSRPGGALFVLWGRRRIGKTALVERFIKGQTSAAYHVASRSTAIEELGRLSHTLASAWDEPLLAAQPLSNAEAFTAFLAGVKGPAVLVLDEFPYLVESMPALPGLLQAAWDRAISKSNLKIVVLGSSVGMMEEVFLSQRSPLFGRRTGQIRLGPLTPSEIEPAFPGTLVHRIEVVAAIGGVPGYLQRLDPSLDLGENLRTRVLHPGEPLYEEVPFLLREELRQPHVYLAILAVVASGARKFGEISSKVGLDRANLTRYLAVLAELGLLEREVSVTEMQPEKSRKGLYRIADPFLSTWFSFVHPHRDLIERGLGDAVYRDLVLPRLHDFLSRAVEPVVRDLIRESALGDLVPFPVARAGRHWSPTAEFDMVLLDVSGSQAFVGELKWSRGPVPVSLLDDLRKRVAREPSLSMMDLTFGLLSRAGFSGRRPLSADERLVDLSCCPEP